MLEYDLTNTAPFDSCSSAQLPTEAETLVITVGLLLIRDAAFSALDDSELVFHPNDLEILASCIEGPLAALARDFGQGQRLRARLTDFVGLRIAQISICDRNGGGVGRT